MDMGEMFRRFFGMGPRSGRQDSDDDFYSTEEWRNKPMEPFLGDENRQNDEFPFSSGIDGMFEHFHTDLFRQMEGLHRQMEDMAKMFGQIEFPAGLEPPPPQPPSQPPSHSPNFNSEESRVFIWSSPPSPFFRQGMDMPERKARNPRDYMLKHDEEAQENRSQPSAPPVPSLPAPENKQKEKPKDNRPFSFRPWKKFETPKKEDSDLDGKLNDDQMLALVKKPREAPAEERSPDRSSFFSGRTVTFSSMRGADGKVESKRVTRDSSGREETTVTRSVGDKTHTVTTIRGADGTEEKQETLSNMDQKDLPVFDEQWNHPSRPQSRDPIVPRATGPGLEAQDRDLFSRLFGWGKR